MKVNYRDLKVLDKSERRNFIESLKELMDSGYFMMGKGVETFEREFASYCSRNQAVGVSSGTSGLVLSLKALSIGKGDEVITTNMSWLATANAIILRGAKPVFVDVGDDLNIEPKAVEDAINENTKAILAVHFCGRICEIEALNDIAKKNDLILIEDASQAAGASYKNRKAGFWGDASAFSLNAMKPLGALGEAGVVLTDSEEIKRKILSLRYLGTKDIEVCEDPDLNHKIDEIQALWLSQRLKILDRTLKKRRNLAIRLANSFPEEVRVIGIEEPERSTFFEFTIDVDNRDLLQEYLSENGIETRIKHPILMCDQPGYTDKNILEVSESRRLVKRILSLPLYPGLREDQCDHIISALKNFLVKNKV